VSRLRIGVDVVDLARFRGFVAGLASAQLDALFSPRELAYVAGRADRVPSLAARFAGKEAVIKALGELDGFALDWREIEVLRADDAPFVALHGRCAELARELGIRELAISLAHSDHVALAQVVALREAAP
jgi:holo-[acyl-carrier protein] synthase